MKHVDRRYHLGSIAKGSLILAVVQFVRAIVEYVEMKMRTYFQDGSMRILVRCGSGWGLWWKV